MCVSLHALTKRQRVLLCVSINLLQPLLIYVFRAPVPTWLCYFFLFSLSLIVSVMSSNRASRSTSIQQRWLLSIRTQTSFPWATEICVVASPVYVWHGTDVCRAFLLLHWSSVPEWGDHTVTKLMDYHSAHWYVLNEMLAAEGVQLLLESIVHGIILFVKKLSSHLRKLRWLKVHC